MPRQITMRAVGRPSGSTVASVIAWAFRMSAKASFSQPSRSGIGSGGSSTGRAGLGMPGLLGGYPTSLAGGPLPIHQGGDDVNDVRRVDRLSQEHVEARGARLAHPEAFGEERHGDRRDVVTRRARSHPSDELEPVLAGQPEVAHDAVHVTGAQDG